MKHLYLTEDEHRAVQILAKGGNHIAVRNECTIPLSGMGFFTSEIRRKTGIRDTLDDSECREYLRQYEEAILSKRWDPLEARIVNLYLDKNPFKAIEYRLRTEGVEVLAEGLQAALDLICRKAGIFTRDEKARRVQLKTYWAAFHLTKPFSSLTPARRKALDLFSSGMTFQQIGYCMGEDAKYAAFLVKAACREIGIVARGRGTQQKLAKVFIQRATGNDPEPEADSSVESPVSMDDPAF